MTSVITDVENFFEGIGTWLGNVESTASSIASKVAADIQYLINSAPAVEQWFAAQIQSIYYQVQGVLSLAMTVVEAASPTIAAIISGAQAAIKAIETFFETTAAAPGPAAL